MLDIVRGVGGALVYFVLAGIVLVFLTNQYPVIEPTTSALIVALCIAAPGIGIILYFFD